MKVIVLVGLPASGKSSIADPTVKKYNIPILETGTFVFKEVEERGLEVSPDNIKAVSMECKEKSDSYFTEKLVQHAEKEYGDRKVIFVSGCRAMSEIDFLNEKFGRDNVMVIGFHASQDTRHKRIANPDRVGGAGAKAAEDKALMNFDNFLAREKKELGFGVGSVFAMADIIIANEDRKYPFSTIEFNQFVFESVVRNFMDA